MLHAAKNLINVSIREGGGEVVEGGFVGEGGDPVYEDADDL